MDWRPPERTHRITTIDAHTAGEPLRVVTSGYPALPGRTMLEKRRAAREQHDGLRRALILEPRGHADMYAAVPTAPVTRDGDVGVLFLHNEGYSTMCGHGIIALVKVGLEAGLFEARGTPPRVKIDTPAGRVTATPELVAGRVTHVAFENVRSFVVERGVRVSVPGCGDVTCDLAYGGAFYAYVDAASVGLALEPANVGAIVELGRAIKHALMQVRRFEHPTGDPDLGFLYGTIFSAAGSPGVHSRNVCVFADGEVDRSPTGTGVSGRAALAWDAGELALGQSLSIESLIGTRFEVRAERATTVGELPALVPVVTGRAWITGRHEFFLDPDDPLADGVLLR